MKKILLFITFIAVLMLNKNNVLASEFMDQGIISDNEISENNDELNIDKIKINNNTKTFKIFSIENSKYIKTLYKNNKIIKNNYLFKTNSNGIINTDFFNLKSGLYYVEIENKKIPIFINEKKELISDYIINNNNSYEINMKKNNKSKFNTKINKIDITTKKQLSGFHMILLDKDGQIIDTFETTDKPYELNLQPGKYTIKEVKTLSDYGYIKSEDFNFYVTKNSKNVINLNTDYTTIKLSGIDKKTNATLDEVKIAVYKYITKEKTIIHEEEEINGVIIPEWTEIKTREIVSKNPITVWIGTPENGACYISYLPIGKYKVVQLGNVDGYKGNVNFDIIVDERNYHYIEDDEVKLNKENIIEAIVEDEYNKLKINIIDSLTKEKLLDNIFELYDSNNNLVIRWEQNEEKYIEKIKEGKYRLTQTYASNGYKKSKDIYIDIVPEKIEIITIRNERDLIISINDNLEEYNCQLLDVTTNNLLYNLSSKTNNIGINSNILIKNKEYKVTYKEQEIIFKYNNGLYILENDIWIRIYNNTLIINK